jgi:hypothetical protein
MLLSTLKIPAKEEEEVEGGGAAVPERVERGAAKVEGTSMVISLSLMKSMPVTFSIIIIIYGA